MKKYIVLLALVCVPSCIILFLPDTSSGSTQLSSFERLKDLANTKMNDLITTDFFEHVNSDGCDLKCRTQGLQAHVSENLYKGPCDIRNAMYLWEQSPTHKAVLDTNYDEGVMYIKRDGNEQCYIVLDLLEEIN